MPSPTTPILDDFNRPDEIPLSFAGAWGTVKGVTQTDLLSLAAQGPPDKTSSARKWAASSFAADQEAYCTIETLSSPPAGGNGVICRYADASQFYDGYLALANAPTSASAGSGLLPSTGIGGPGSGFNGTLTLFALANLVHVREETVQCNLAPGDRLWLECRGTAITAYIDHLGAGFLPVIAWTDATIPGGGNLGIYFEERTARSVAFGGGNI